MVVPSSCNGAVVLKVNMAHATDYLRVTNVILDRLLNTRSNNLVNIGTVDIVSDGIAVVFSTGEAFYLAGSALHTNLDLLGACPLTLGDPSPMDPDPRFVDGIQLRMA